MLVDDPRPAVHPDHRHDAVLLVGEGIDLAGEGVQAILISDDQKGHHLGVGDGAIPDPEGGGLEGIDDLVFVEGKALGEFLDQGWVHGVLL